MQTHTLQADVIRVNGQVLAVGDEPEEQRQDLARLELLRQALVARALWPDEPLPEGEALDEPWSQRFEQSVDALLAIPMPDEAACRQRFEHHQPAFRQGRRVELVHVLYAVTPRVPVQALRARAEGRLKALLNDPNWAVKLAALAREESNCPSGQQGGQLGWVGPGEIAPELSSLLFPDSTSQPAPAAGLLPRVTTSRHGFHLLAVVSREDGSLPEFEALHDRIALDLWRRTRAIALEQLLQRLAAAADLEGVTLPASASALVQ